MSKTPIVAILAQELGVTIEEMTKYGKEEWKAVAAKLKDDKINDSTE